MIFNNNRYLNKQVFEIQKSKLLVGKKNLFDAVEYEISYEQIENKKKINSTINHGLLVTGFFLFVFGLIFLLGDKLEVAGVLMVLALLFPIIAFTSRKNTISISVYDGSKIELYFNRQTRQEVLDFANQIIQVSDNFLLNKYAKIDPALPIEPQLNNIQFLRNREVISEDEYEELKNKLLGRQNKSSIGFGY